MPCTKSREIVKLRTVMCFLFQISSFRFSWESLTLDFLALFLRMHRQTMMTIMRATASRQANRIGSHVDTGIAIKKIMLQVLTKQLNTLPESLN